MPYMLLANTANRLALQLVLLTSSSSDKSSSDKSTCLAVSRVRPTRPYITAAGIETPMIGIGHPGRGQRPSLLSVAETTRVVTNENVLSSLVYLFFALAHSPFVPFKRGANFTTITRREAAKQKEPQTRRKTSASVHSDDATPRHATPRFEKSVERQ